MSASADGEVVKTLYSGEPKQVNWDAPLKIEADQFAEGVNVGYYISIKTSATSGAIELKDDLTWLPGSREYRPGVSTEAAEFRTYITEDMLNVLKEKGLIICGDEFTLTEASVCNDGFVMPAGAIWGGYAWINEWSSLFLFKSAFDNYGGQRYMDIYLSDYDLQGYTGYFLQVMTAFNNSDALWAGNDAIVHEVGKATVDLKNINVKEALAAVSTLIIQGNKEQGNPFNINAIVLRGETGTTIVNDFVNDNDTTVTVYNLQGMAVKTNTTIEKAKATLPAGIYIANGKKFLVK